MKLQHLLTVAALALLTAAARPQDTTRREAAQAPAARGATDADDFSDVSPEELPNVRRAIDDEALHRDRIGRIHRLRELAAQSGDRSRLAQLDELERREVQLRDTRRVRSRAMLSDDTWRRTQDFFSRGGVMRARVANHQAMRERAAQAGTPQRQGTRGTSPSRPSAPRSSSGSSSSHGGGRSPR
jgi:hypothetical protein